MSWPSASAEIEHSANPSRWRSSQGADVMLLTYELKAERFVQGARGFEILAPKDKEGQLNH